MAKTLDIRVVPASSSPMPEPQVPMRRVADARRYDRADVAWLDQVAQGDERNVGTKAALLGELLELGVPVPLGFVLTTRVFGEFLRTNRIDRLISRLLDRLPAEDMRALQRAAGEVQAAIERAELTPKLRSLVADAYQELRLRPGGSLRVAVRPSNPPLDRSDLQFAGHHTTALAVAGNAELEAAIKAVWASVFTPRAVYYRRAHDLDHLDAPVALLIQQMVEADVAGVLLTVDPSRNDSGAMVVDAAWGLGEAVVRGLLTPDRYTLEKSSLEVLDQAVTTQRWKLERPKGERAVIHVPVSGEAQALPKLAAEQLRTLGEYGKTIEGHFQFPQNIEWAIARGQVFITQTSPIPRVTRKLTLSASGQSAPRGPRPLLTGTSAALGVARGPVRIVHQHDDLDRIQPGDVLVSELTTPDILPVMEKVAAIVTDTGGRTSHAALLSHEFGIPAIVGTGNATHILHEGQTVTVDGATGHVYLGSVDLGDRKAALGRAHHRTVRTATKVMLNLGAPSQAEAAAKLGADGVGLIRAEFMIASMGEHPKALLAAGRVDEYVAHLATNIERFARAFHPHPVVYRAADFKTNEYRGLAGGREFEPHEENPMLGYRGTARYLRDPGPFQAELAALKEVRARRGWDNVQLMLPFVRTVQELRQAKEYIAAAGLMAERTFKLRMMVEVPSNVFLIEEFLDEGIHGVSIGSNDLTQLILGVDRDAEHLRDEFNEMDPAVLKAISTVIQAARARHVPVTVCGQAAGTNPQFAEFLVRQGVTALSVDPALADQTREVVASIEHHLPRH